MARFYPKKLRSRKGAILSIVTYSMLTLLAAYSASTYISAVNGGNQIRATLSSLQAQYQAYKGIEYAYRAVMDSAFGPTPFLTHRVPETCYNNESCVLLEIAPAPPAPFGGCILSGEYVYNDNGTCADINPSTGIGFKLKTYKNGDDILILSRGYHKGKAKLFISKVLGNDAYKYFIFFQGDVNLGRQTLDAGGAKIQANGAIQLFEKLKISNADEIRSSGPIYLNYTPHVAAGTEDDYAMYRYPWWTPYFNADPPNNQSGVYLNSPDGHYAGTLYGLYMFKPGSGDIPTKFVPWDGSSTNPQGTYKPLPPEPLVNCKGDRWCNAQSNNGQHYPIAGAPLKADGTPPVWQSLNENLAAVYEQKPTVEADGSLSVLANFNNFAKLGYIDNQNYNPDFPNVNGVYIPSRLSNEPEASYYVSKYRSASCNPQSPDANCALTNITHSQKQADSWEYFISRFPKTITKDDDGNIVSITGLAGATSNVLTADTNEYKTPPKIDIQQFADAAANQGMIVKKSGNNLVVTINGNAVDVAAGCGSNVFSQRTFMNAETAKKNEVIEINVKELLDCAGQDPTSVDYKKWIPNNNIISAEVGIALSNASQLPVGGLTTIVHGNLILKGQFNKPDPNTEPNGWQPAAAIVSDYTYLVSDQFNWPSALPYSQHHVDYPYTRAYNGVTLPAGKDYTVGYNWLSQNDGLMAKKAGAPASGLVESQAGFDGVYHYNISLIGKDGYNPRFLERWKYYGSPGNAGTPPDSASLKNFKAVVSGAFIQLGPSDFPATSSKPEYPINPRLCSDTSLKTDINGTPVNNATYPCRTNVNYPPEDFVALNDNEEKKYEKKYASTNMRPPGSDLGLIPSSLLEVADTDENWTTHNIQWFPRIERN